MSFYLMVVVSDIPANKEIGLDCDCYFHTGNITELAKKMNDICQSVIERPTYGYESI